MAQFLHSFAQLTETPFAAKLKQRDNLKRRADYAPQAFTICLLHELQPGQLFRFINSDGKPAHTILTAIGTLNAAGIVPETRSVRTPGGAIMAAKSNARVIVSD